MFQRLEVNLSKAYLSEILPGPKSVDDVVGVLCCSCWSW